ncbi:unnamed protein product [Blepharisma stoltei]|uniref:EF-hand domain-containing protein n=1 Tax=Blepharisma stoltei TaxID=1481888 RepID=A0AAU9JC24_9CILI|nr:unnamed protein product [Blepharisma stoltei]
MFKYPYFLIPLTVNYYLQMLGLETERKLAQLLYILSQGEKQVEAARQNLCQNREFEPYSAFKFLDRAGLGSISLIDVLSFLERNRVYCTEQDCQLLIRQYDANSDGRLSLSEFTQLALPSANQLLRDLTQARPAYPRVSSDVEYLLMRLFETEIQVQRDMEDSRKNLAERYDFNLIDAYRAIDVRRGSGFERAELFSFMRRHEFMVLDEDIDAIYRRIDNDGDGIISYSEFVDGLLPAKPVRGSLRSSAGFSEVRASSPLRRSPSRSSPLRESPMRSTYTSSPSKSFYEPRASSPLRRSSPSRNEITYQSPRRSSPLRFSPLRSSSPSRIESSYQSRSPLRNSSPLRRSSPSRTDSLYQSRSPLRNSSPLRSSPSKSVSFYQSPEKNSSIRSPEKTFSSSRRSHSSAKKSDYSSPNKSRSRNGKLSYSEFSIYEENELVSMLQEQIRLNRDLDKLKIELSLKPDFNLVDAFRIFDLNDRSAITTLDVESAIQEMAPIALRDEVYLLIRHYSSLQDGQLRFSDFSEMFTPKQEDYSRLLRNRQPYNVSFAQRRRVFSRDTTSLFIDVLRLHLDAERVAESLRQRLSRRPEFNMHEAFQAIDRDRNGYITIDEFKDILEDHNIFVNRKDLEALMQRYDKNKDGRVSYSEFVQEVTPKSPRKY